MSQGTTIIIHAENKNGEKHNFLYGTTWGIGRVMPTVLMRLVTLSEVLFLDCWSQLTSKYFDKFKMSFRSDGIFDIAQEWKKEGKDKEFLEKLDKAPLFNLSEIQNFIDEFVECAEYTECGAMVIWAKQKPNLQTEFSYSLLDSEYNPIKYIDWVKDFRQNDCNDNFNTLFNAFCEHFNVKEKQIG